MRKSTKIQNWTWRGSDDEKKFLQLAVPPLEILMIESENCRCTGWLRARLATGKASTLLRSKWNQYLYEEEKKHCGTNSYQTSFNLLKLNLTLPQLLHIITIFIVFITTTIIFIIIIIIIFITFCTTAIIINTRFFSQW